MDGTITAIAQGGCTDKFYQYELVGPVSHLYSEQNYFDNFESGHYIVNRKHNKGCIESVGGRFGSTKSNKVHGDIN